MSRDLSQSERRLAALAAIGLLWGALLVALGLSVLLVAGVLGVLLLTAGAALQRRALVAALEPRVRRIDWTQTRQILRARATSARELAAGGSRRALAAADAAGSAVAPGRRDGPRLNKQAARMRSEDRFGEALELSEQALEIFRRLGDRRGEALTLNGLGLTQARVGDEASAVDSYEAAVAILTELGDSHGAGRVLANLGSLHRGQGNEEQARTTWSDALERLEPGTPEHDRTAQQLELAS